MITAAGRAPGDLHPALLTELVDVHEGGRHRRSGPSQQVALPGADLEFAQDVQVRRRLHSLRHDVGVLVEGQVTERLEDRARPGAAHAVLDQ